MDGHIITDQNGKEDAFYIAYKELLGKDSARDFTLDLEGLGVMRIDLSEQDHVFIEDEIWGVIKEMPSDKAPGSDGFIGLFFQKAWEIIKEDIVAAVHKLFLGNGGGLEGLTKL